MNKSYRLYMDYVWIERLIIFSFFAWITFSIFFGESIPANNGNGWDGILYAAIAQDFPNHVLHHHLSQYTLQRIFPSGIIFLSTHLFNYSLTFEQTPVAFSIYNAVILVVAVFVWNAIANKLKWNSQVRVFSFAALFLNFAILKMNTYYPVLTDTSAFVLTLCLLYFYLLEKKSLVLFGGILSAFTFPTLLLIALLLFVVPGKNWVDEKKSPKDRPSFLIAFTLSVCAWLMIISIYYVIGPMGNFSIGKNTNIIILSMSIITLFSYIFYVVYPACNNFKQAFTFFKQASVYRLLIAILVAICSHYIIVHFSDGTAGILTPVIFLEVISVNSLAYPFIYVVSHVMYFGPIIFLLGYFWADIVGYLKEQNRGLFFIAIFYSVIFINTESRQLINFLPFVVLFVAEILNNKKISWNFTYSFTFLSLLISRFWLPLNHGEWPSLPAEPAQVILSFPMQWYFMNHGPWMSYPMYLINLIVVSFLFFITYKLLKKSGNIVAQ